MKWSQTPDFQHNLEKLNVTKPTSKHRWKSDFQNVFNQSFVRDLDRVDTQNYFMQLQICTKINIGRGRLIHFPQLRRFLRTTEFKTGGPAN